MRSSFESERIVIMLLAKNRELLRVCCPLGVVAEEASLFVPLAQSCRARFECFPTTEEVGGK